MSIRIPFGKHRGTSIEDLDEGYLRWLLTIDHGWVLDNAPAIRDVLRDMPILRAEAFEADYTLSSSQNEAADTIVDGFFSGVRMQRLEGGAGYGKTFVILEIIRRMMAEGTVVHACATSYVASEVLRKQLSGLKVETRTIASLFQLYKTEEEDREEYTIAPRTIETITSLVQPGMLLVIDEYSMVNDDIATVVMRLVEIAGGYLLVVGDLAQLPPVRQGSPSVFSNIQHGFTLVIPMRYDADSDLGRLEQQARKNPHSILNGEVTLSEQVHLHEDTEALISRYVEDMVENPREDARMLFFRRADVAAANNLIRARLFGEDASKAVCDDERLMVLATQDQHLGEMGPDGRPKATRFYSGQSFLVSLVEHHVTETEYQIPCYRIGFFDRVWGGSAHPLTAVVQGGRGWAEYHETLASLKEAAKETNDWRAYREFKNSFILLGYSYAMTVHRCQGQTVDRAYFNPAMLAKSGGMARKLAYVAATRAKKEVHIVANPEGGE